MADRSTGPEQPPREPARRLALELLDLGSPVDPGRTWCLARASSSPSSSSDAPDPARAEEHFADGEGEADSPLVALLRKTLAPRPSDQSSSSSSSGGALLPPSAASTSATPQSTSFRAPGCRGPREQLTWAGNGAVWTKGAEVVRSFVFGPDELVRAATFATFENEPPASTARPGEAAVAAAAAADLSLAAASEEVDVLPPRPRGRSSQARAPRVSEGASFVRQSTHTPRAATANANSSAFLQPAFAPAPPPTAGPEAGRPAAAGPQPATPHARAGRPSTRALCFLFADSLLTVLASGARHVVSLPCPMEPTLQAVEGGGLALRARSTSGVDDGALEPGRPFVVLHPLNGVVPGGADAERALVLVESDPPVSALPPWSAAPEVDLLVRGAPAGVARVDGAAVHMPSDTHSTAQQLGDVFETRVPETLDTVAVKLPDVDRVDPLVRLCLGALDGALPDDGLSALRLECVQRANRTGSSDNEEGNDEFEAFKSALLARLGLASREETPGPAPAPALSAWARISRLNALSEDPAFRALSPSTADVVPPQGPSPFAGGSASGPSPPGEAAAVLVALHLLAEDFRLDILQFRHLRALGRLVMRISLAVGRRDWADYWFRQGCPMPRETLSPSSARPMDTSLSPPPDIYNHLRAILAGKASPSDIWPASSPSRASQAPSLAAIIIDLYSTLSTMSPLSAADSPAKVVGLMVEHGLTKERLLRIPFGIALPLMAAVKTCQSSPSASWSPAAFKLIRRPDLAPPAAAREPHATSTPSEPRSIRMLAGPPSERKEVDTAVSASLSLRFGSDRRLEEVDRLLSTTRVSTFKLRDEAGLSEQEVTAQHQAHAGMLTSRTLAIPAGQGMFTYSTRAAPTTSVFAIPSIDTTVKTSWDGGVHVVQPPFAEPEKTQWAEFANGVAQALQIRSDSPGIDSSWIVYNKPKELNPSHGGFLLGLGLAGHLRKMMPWHAFPYFDARHEPTSVGLLLGFAASHLATGDPLLTKIMSLHVHALLPHGSRELHSTPLVQAASLLGIGLLYLGSGHRRMADVALSEIPRQNSSEEAPEASQAYAFSAAMAFGMVMLGRGGEATRSGDPLLVARLRTLIYGRAPGGGSAHEPKSSRDVTPDLNVTSGPATLALGLMYLRTDREEIAGMLEIPQSANDLQVVRPDLLFSRTLARNLILWGQITDTEAWIESNVPAFIRSPLGKRARGGESAGARQAMDLAHCNILAGACFALALKYAGTARSSVHSLLLHTYDTFYAQATVNASSFQQRVRLSAARSCLCVVALSLAMVMAGTGELSVLSRLRLSHGQHEKFGYGVHQALHMALGLLFLGKGMSTVGNSKTAVAAMVCAFFPNFNIQSDDNAAYPQAFRHLWALAVEPRCFVARDVESREPVYLPIKVKTEENGAFGSHHLISPTLLPPLERLVSVTIDSPRYWPLVLNLRQGKARAAAGKQRHGMEGVLVKRRSGFLSYADDPKGNRTIFVKAGLTTGTTDLGSMSVAPVAQEGLQSLRDSVAAYTSDPFLLAFVRQLCAPSSGAAAPSANLQKFCESVLLECLVNDQPHLIAVYLHLRHVGASAPAVVPVAQVRNLQFATEHAGASPASGPGDSRHASTLFRQSFLRETADGMTTTSGLELARNAALRSHLQAYARTGGDALATLAAADQARLAMFLASARVPPLGVLDSLKAVVLEARAHLDGLAMGSAEQRAVLRLVLRSTLGRLQAVGVPKGGAAEDGDLGWVDAALGAWTTR